MWGEPHKWSLRIAPYTSTDWACGYSKPNSHQINVNCPENESTLTHQEVKCQPQIPTYLWVFHRQPIKWPTYHLQKWLRSRKSKTYWRTAPHRSDNWDQATTLDWILCYEDVARINGRAWIQSLGKGCREVTCNFSVVLKRVPFLPWIRVYLHVVFLSSSSAVWRQDPQPVQSPQCLEPCKPS